MKNIVDFNKKHIMVVGASSVGIKTAETICKLGARVDIADVNIQDVDRIIDSFDGHENHSFYLNVSNANSIADSIGDACERFGKYDGLFYTANVVKRIMLSDCYVEEIKKQFEVNFYSFYETVRQLTVQGRYNSGMRIVSISSVSSLKGIESYAAFSASKAAMDSAIKTMAIELAPKGICINSIIAGFIKSQFYEEYKNSIEEDDISFRIFKERQFMGVGEAQDIANIAAFLLSDASKFFTGQSIVADGGYSS